MLNIVKTPIKINLYIYTLILFLCFVCNVNLYDYLCEIFNSYKMVDINDILKAKGLSKKELAIQMGISKVMLHRILSGNPTLNNLNKLASVLDVPISSLFSQSDKDIPSNTLIPSINQAKDVNAAIDTLKQIAHALNIPIKDVFEQSAKDIIKCPHCGGKIKLCKE